MPSETNTDLVPVTFVFPAATRARTVAVAGEFNAWSVDAHVMERRDDDSFAITIALRPGRRYQYRYLVDGEEWENDWSADAYVPNEYGGNNSQVDLTEGSPRVVAAHATTAPAPTSSTTTVAPDAAAGRPPQKRKQQQSAMPSADRVGADDAF